MMNRIDRAFDAVSLQRIRNPEELAFEPGKRSCGEAMHMAFVSEDEGLNQCAHWSDPGLKETWAASPGVPLGVVDAAASAWTLKQDLVPPEI